MYKNRDHILGIMKALAANALKSKATKVEVHIEQLEDEVFFIKVTDNGAGFDKEHLEEIRRRLDQPRREELEKYYGALVGESMISSAEFSLIGMMTERAEVFSEPGKGTQVRVYLRS